MNLFTKAKERRSSNKSSDFVIVYPHEGMWLQYVYGGTVPTDKNLPDGLYPHIVALTPKANALMNSIIASRAWEVGLTDDDLVPLGLAYCRPNRTAVMDWHVGFRFMPNTSTAELEVELTKANHRLQRFMKAITA